MFYCCCCCWKQRAGGGLRRGTCASREVHCRVSTVRCSTAAMRARTTVPVMESTLTKMSALLRVSDAICLWQGRLPLFNRSPALATTCSTETATVRVNYHIIVLCALWQALRSLLELSKYGYRVGCCGEKPENLGTIVPQYRVKGRGVWGRNPPIRRSTNV